MKRIKIVKNRVAALCLSMFLALGLIAPAFNFEAKAEALPQVLESSATVADCVMTYYAMSGSAIANTEWINTLYSSLGSDFGTLGQFADQGLMTYVDGVWQPVDQLAQNIANTSAYTKLGLDTVFNVSAEEVASGGGYAVATGASTLAGAVGCVASNGILPVLGGVTAAYWGGIAVGTLINHLIDYAGKAITNGNPITSAEYLNSLGAGVGSYSSISNDSTKYILSSNGVVYGVKAGNFVYVIVLNGNVTGNQPWDEWNLTTNSRAQRGNAYLNNGAGQATMKPFSQYKTLPYSYTVEDINGLNKYLQGLGNGTIEPPQIYSPDVIGPDGNQNGNYDSDTGKYQVPNMLPQINPGTQSGKPLSLDDWLAFANGVQNNNNGVSPVPDNSSLFQDLLDAIRQTIPGGGTDPDPGPGTDPGTVPVPTPNPDPDYDVDQPDTNAQESETPETDPNLNPPDFVLPNLMEKFPFCIPNDIATIFGKFRNQTRQAPYISWRFNPPGTPIDYTFNLNLSEFEEVAALLRTLELIAFVVGLAYATRYLIGSS